MRYFQGKYPCHCVTEAEAKLAYEKGEKVIGVINGRYSCFLSPGGWNGAIERFKFNWGLHGVSGEIAFFLFDNPQYWEEDSCEHLLKSKV